MLKAMLGAEATWLGFERFFKVTVIPTLFSATKPHPRAFTVEPGSETQNRAPSLKLQVAFQE